MSVSVIQYIESLENPAGRFRTLQSIFPCRNDDGSLRLRTHRRYVDFDVTIPSGRAVLRAPLGTDNALDGMRILAARLARMHSPFLLPFEFREAEMTVFDASMRPRQIDICIQRLPQHSTLEEFLQTQSASGSTAQIERILPLLTELASWGRKNAIGITPAAVIVTQDGKGLLPRLVSVAKIDCSSQIIIATLLTALLPGMYGRLGRQIIMNPTAVGKSAELLSVVLRGTRYEEIAALAAGCDAKTYDTILKNLSGYTHEDFCNMSRLFEKERLPLQRIYRRSETEHANALSHYYFIDRTCGDILCVRDNDGWKYVDSDGHAVIERTFRYAMPLREGRAEVETETGHGLIDGQGRFVLPPEYEEVCWDEYHGIVVVMQYGQWSIRSRDGKTVGNERFDYIGDFSEGLAPAMRRGKWGFVNIGGGIAVPLRFEDVSGFSDGRAQVTENGRTFTIDRSGREIAPEQNRPSSRQV